MDKSFSATTKKINKSPTCSFPHCETLLSNYNKNAFCSVHQTPEYQGILEKLKRGEELEALKISEAKLLPGRSKVQVLIRPNYIFPPIRVKERGRHRCLVSNKKPRKCQEVFLNREPDLFARFCELEKKEEAYLNFASRYGLFGIWKIYEDKGDWEESEEPLVLINDFHHRFKKVFGEIQAYIKDKPFKEAAELQKDLALRKTKKLLGYFDRWLKSPAVVSYLEPMFSDGLILHNITFYNTTLSGALVLQLYRFFSTGKVLKICELPTCDKLHTREKFCSLDHQRLFNAWKKRGLPRDLIKKGYPKDYLKREVKNERINPKKRGQLPGPVARG